MFEQVSELCEGREGDICVIATYGKEVEINATHLTRTSLNMRGSMGSCREDYMFLEVIVGLIQALIFAMLILAYLTMATSTEEH